LRCLDGGVNRINGADLPIRPNMWGKSGGVNVLPF
jgi:hypothetical protein